MKLFFLIFGSFLILSISTACSTNSTVETTTQPDYIKPSYPPYNIAQPTTDPFTIE